MDGLPLFESRYAPSDDITASRHRGNAQSEAAFRRTKNGRALLHARILAFVREAGGATCWEIHQELGIGYTTSSARCAEMRRDGRLVPTGEKRRTITGSFAAVLAVAE